MKMIASVAENRTKSVEKLELSMDWDEQRTRRNGYFPTIRDQTKNGYFPTIRNQTKNDYLLI